MEWQRFEGVPLPDPAFAGDTGAVAPDVATALAAYAAEPRSYAAALAALQRSRLLVPVVAVLGDVDHDEAGRATDKSSEMATVLLTGHDGRLALLAFTGALSLPALFPAVAVWLPGSLAGNYLGASLGSRLPERLFRRLTLGLAFLAGALTAVSA